MSHLLLLVFAVFDVKANAFLPPFFVRTDGQALRMFTDEVNKEGSEFNRHAEDYALFRLGTYDQEKGFMASEAQPVHLVNALTVVLRTELGKVPKVVA